MSRARELDQFYTSRPVAKECIDILLHYLGRRANIRFLEPSAGDGAFLEQLPKAQRVGVDLDPKGTLGEIICADFLGRSASVDAFVLPNTSGIDWVVIGNPPFGKNASLAVDFFNKAAEFSQVVAFIVPRTFNKSSVQKRLSRHFHLVENRALARDSFLFEGEAYSVPCAFQIWERRAEARQTTPTPLEHTHFKFISGADASPLTDFGFRRVGALAGKVIPEFRGYSPASHYFLRPNLELVSREQLIARLGSISWDSVRMNTAGNPSISKRELVSEYSKIAE